MIGGERYLAGASGPGWEIRVREALVKRLIGAVLTDCYDTQRLHRSSLKATPQGIDVTWWASVRDDAKAGWLVLDGRNRLRDMLARLGLRLGAVRVTVFRPRKPRGEVYELRG